VLRIKKQKVKSGIRKHGHIASRGPSRSDRGLSRLNQIFHRVQFAMTSGLHNEDSGP
jgi:hypothetical protein